MLCPARFNFASTRARTLLTTRFPYSRMPASTSSLPTPAVYMSEGGGNEELAAYQKHQSNAIRINASEASRTLMRDARFGMLSTVAADGSPQASVVEFALNDEERGVISLLSLAKGFEDMTGARFSLSAKVKLVTDAEEKAQIREIYLSKYPDSFFVDFPDFNWFLATEIKSGRWIGGFAQARTVSAAEYLASKPDPVSAFSAPVCGHMNVDHSDDMKAMIQHYSGLKVESPVMKDLDRLGINFTVNLSASTAPLPLRLNYPSPAEDRKAIKDQIVTMTRAAKGV